MKCVKIKDVKLLEVAEMEMPASKNGDVTFKINSSRLCGSDIHY